jgi:hypothetical protein
MYATEAYFVPADRCRLQGFAPREVIFKISLYFGYLGARMSHLRYPCHALPSTCFALVLPVPGSASMADFVDSKRRLFVKSGGSRR